MKTSRSLAATIAVALSLATPASAWAGHLLDNSGNDAKQATKVEDKADKAAQKAADKANGNADAVVPATPAPSATPTPTATPSATPTPASDAGKGKDKSKDKGNAGHDTPADPGSSDDPEPTLPPAASPVAGERVAATPAAGVVSVKLPGSDTYVPLDQAASMPVGSRIDARDGTVVLHAALPGVGTEAGTFTGAQFVVRQDTRRQITELRLVGGDFGKCADRSLASTHRNTKTVVRSLWGADHGGHFRTHGHNSVATVRGTKWLTEDRCDGTVTKVTQGAVSVYDRRAHRTVVVNAGHSYLARRHPR